MQFGVSRELAIVHLSLYTLGMGIGPLFAAPLSELFDRRIIYILSMPLFLVFTSGAGVAQNIQTLVVCRFLAGTLGTAPLAIGAGTSSDIWDLEKDGGIAGLLFIMAAFLGPCLGELVNLLPTSVLTSHKGPLTGAYIISEYNNDWRYSMWVALIVGAPTFVLSLFMNGTLKARILRTKSRDREITKTSAVEQLNLKRILIIATTRPVRMLFTEPLVFYLSVYTAFGFAMLFSFFGSYPLVFMEVYHFNMKSTGLAFIGILVDFIFAVITFAVLDKTGYQRVMRASVGRVAPEHRLYASMIGSVMLPISLFWSV
jgi:MFS family permease